MKKERKSQEIEALKANLESNSAVFISRYHGLTVEKFSLLRKEMRGTGALLKVFKNTLTKIAIKETHAEPLSEHLTGSNFLVFTNDPLASAKVLSKFAQDNPDNVEIKAGYYQTVLDKNAVNVLATLPSKEVLIGKFMSVLKSPQIRLVFTLKSPVVKLLRTLKAIEAERPAA